MIKSLVGTAHIKSGTSQSHSSRRHLLSNGWVNTFPHPSATHVTALERNVHGALNKLSWAVTIWFVIWEAPGLNLSWEPDYIDWGFSYASLVPPNNCLGYHEMGPDHFLLHPFLLIYH
jgi:hypothetical protein